MVRFGRERRHGVSQRSAPRAAKGAVMSLPPARSDQASVITDAAPSVNRKAASNCRTEIEHRPVGELGGPRSQPYTVWYRGKIVYFCTTRDEAAEALGRELQQSKLRAVFDGGGDAPEAPGIG